jgi:hypothetical protein
MEQPAAFNGEAVASCRGTDDRSGYDGGSVFSYVTEDLSRASGMA